MGFPSEQDSEFFLLSQDILSSLLSWAWYNEACKYALRSYGIQWDL